MSKRTLVTASILVLAGLALVVFLWPSGADKSSKAKRTADNQAVSGKRANTGESSEALSKLSGQVVGPDSQGLAGAAVLLTPRGDSPPELAASDAVAIADAQGRFQFSELHAGAYAISATAADHLAAHAQVQLIAGAARNDLRLQLTAGGHTLSGMVRDRTGGTIAAATVHLVAGQGDTSSASTVAVQSDNKGEYHVNLASGRYLAWAYHPDYVPESKMLVIGSSDQRLDFDLAPGAQIEGEVRRAADDAPVAFAKVWYQSDAGDALFAGATGAGSVLADGQGRFRITGLQAGAILLRARLGKLVSAEPSEVSLGIADATSDVVLYLGDGFSLRGQVVDAKSKAPVAGLLVSAAGKSGAVKALAPSAEGGSFAIEGLAPSSYRLQAEGSGYLPQLFGNTVVVSDDVEGVKIEVERGAMLRGRVEPARVATVAVDMRSVVGFSSNVLQRTQSEEDGSFVIGPFTPGSIVLQAESSDGMQGQLDVLVAGVDQGDLVIALQASGSLHGRVIDSKGKAQDDVRVSLRPSGDQKRSFEVNGEDMLAKSARTSPDGSFSILGIDEGAYLLTVVDAQGQALRWASERSSTGSQPKELRFGKQERKENMLLKVEKRDAVIEGVVLGPDGQPAADVWITASASRMAEPMTGPIGGKGQEDDQNKSEERGESRVVISMSVDDSGGGGGGAPGVDYGSARDLPPVLSNERGEFVISGLREGLYDLRADGLKGSARAHLREVKSGSENVRIKLASLTRIEGVVRQGSEPVTDFVVELQGVTMHRKRVRAKDGSFVLQRIDPGPYTIVARNNAGSAEAQIEVLAGQATKVELAMETLTQVTGRIVDESGAPLAKLLVIAAPMQEGGGMAMMIDDDTEPTGADGSFALGVKPGKYMLIALSPEQGPIASVAFTVDANTGAMDLGDVRQEPGGGLPGMSGGEESEDIEMGN